MWDDRAPRNLEFACLRDTCIYARIRSMFAFSQPSTPIRLKPGHQPRRCRAPCAPPFCANFPDELLFSPVVKKSVIAGSGIPRGRRVHATLPSHFAPPPPLCSHHFLMNLPKQNRPASNRRASARHSAATVSRSFSLFSLPSPRGIPVQSATGPVVPCPRTRSLDCRRIPAAQKIGNPAYSGSFAGRPLTPFSSYPYMNTP